MQRLEPKLKFKDIFNSWLWSLSLVLHFTLCTLILFSHELLTFYFLHLHFYPPAGRFVIMTNPPCALRTHTLYLILDIKYNLAYSSPGRPKMSTPIKRKRNKERMIKIRPVTAEVIVSLAPWIFWGSPEEVISWKPE